MPRLTYEMEQALKKDCEAMHATEEQHRQQEQEKLNQAAATIVTALGPLTKQCRERVLKAALVLLGIDEAVKQ